MLLVAVSPHCGRSESRSAINEFQLAVGFDRNGRIGSYGRPRRQTHVYGLIEVRISKMSAIFFDAGFTST